MNSLIAGDRNKTVTHLLIAGLLSLPVASPLSATETQTATPDYAREQRLGDEIRDAIFDGEVIEINDGNRDFMAIQMDADDEPKGGAIILHGRGYHSDWEDVAHPLRVGLAEKGWTTLSIQLPVLEKQAKYYDYVPLFPEAKQRIDAAIQHLRDQDISPIVLIAHSCGAHMAMDWVRQNGDEKIDAFAGLGLGATDYQQYMAEPFPLDKMSVPVLDLYGEKEFPAVIKMAPERLKMIKAAGNEKSAQAILPEADHYFHGKGEELTGAVAEWLDKL
ncbi:MAG: DUF3530 family protein [Thiolinea sp.]